MVRNGLPGRAARRNRVQTRGERGKAGRSVSSELNVGRYPMVNRLTRLTTRYCGREQPLEEARQAIGERLDALAAAKLGLVTFTPDDLDWDEEVRIALEERASISPDAPTGMEASLGSTGAESMETRICASLTDSENGRCNRPTAARGQGGCGDGELGTQRQPNHGP